MTTSLRAASMTSNLYGEVHILVSVPAKDRGKSKTSGGNSNPLTTNDNSNTAAAVHYDIWKQDLERMTTTTTKSSSYNNRSKTVNSSDTDRMDIENADNTDYDTINNDSNSNKNDEDDDNNKVSVIEKLQQELLQRRNTVERRKSRIHQIAQSMSNSTSTDTAASTTSNAYKVTMQYTIPSLEYSPTRTSSSALNLGGLQVHNNNDNNSDDEDDNTSNVVDSPYLYCIGCSW
jgi:hypothetical protein